MFQFGTIMKKSVVVCGSILVATVVAASFAGILLASSSKSADAAIETYQVLGTSQEGVIRQNVGTGEISVCTVDLGGTLSCAATEGQ
jgi:hypothetical protein